MEPAPGPAVPTGAPSFAATEPHYTSGRFHDGSSTGLTGTVTITNGPEQVAENHFYLSMYAEALDGQTQHSASDAHWLSKFEPFETRSVSTLAQADPGRWNVVMAIQDAAGQFLKEFAAQE